MQVLSFMAIGSLEVLELCDRLSSVVHDRRDSSLLFLHLVQPSTITKNPSVTLSSLTHLCMQDMHFPQASISPFLSQCTGLKNLCFNNCSVALSDPGALYPIARLPDLATLRITYLNDEDALYLLACIDAPALHTLSLRDLNDFGFVNCAPVLQNTSYFFKMAYDRSRPLLRSFLVLDLWNIHSSREEFAFFLSHCSAVERIILHDCTPAIQEGLVLAVFPDKAFATYHNTKRYPKRTERALPSLKDVDCFSAGLIGFKTTLEAKFFARLKLLLRFSQEDVTQVFSQTTISQSERVTILRVLKDEFYRRVLVEDRPERMAPIWISDNGDAEVNNCPSTSTLR